MNKNIYYLSIQSTSLAHYMSKALILPSRFYKNRPSDIQNINSDYLVLSKKKLLNNSNCSIELVLDDEEVNYLTELEDDNTFLYSKSIPISRVKKVYFIDEVQKLKTIDNINKGIGFISEKFIEVIEEDSINVNTLNDYNNKYSSELESKIKTYNHILGGLSFVRHTSDGEYTKNYFSILSHFNNFIQSQISNRYDKYDGAFTHNGDFWSKLSPLLYENISEKDVLNFSQQEKINIEKSNGIFKYDTINSRTTTYKLAILNTYGENSSKRKKTNDLISDCKNGKIPKEKQEGIALIYGINSGYASFRNQYDKKIVKFKMESLLDYYTIESVFQYVINDKKDNEKFEYIDEIFPDEELVLDIVKKAFDLEEYSTNIFKYFTENILNISLKELFNNIINQFKNTFIEEMDKKDSELKNTKLKIEELNQKVVTKANELQKQEDIVNQLNKNKDILNEDIQKKNEKNYFLNQQLEERNKELQSIQNSIKQLEQQNKILNQNIKEKDQNINSLQDDYKNKKSELEEKNDNINSLENKIEKQNNIMNKLEDDKKELNRNIDNKVHQINNLNKSIEDKDKSINFLKQEVETKDNESQREKINFEELNKEKEKVEERYNLLEKEAKEKDERNNTLTQDIANQNNEIRELNNSIEDNKVTFDEEKERIYIEQDLHKLRVKDLKELASEKGLKFKSKIKKQELIELLKIETDKGLL